MPDRSIARICGHVLVWLLLSTSALADVWVIGAADGPVQQLDRSEAAGLFLGVGGNPWGVRVRDSSDRALYASFYRALTERSPASIRAHWAQRVFSGRGRPPAKIAPHELEDALRADPSLITYVPAGQLPPGARIVLDLAEEDRQ
ncbi:MAG: hypothetical protein KDJ27_00090 [Gammaproteobacteria bacterium]|nr:hypothetical protein [Gammaproteobacteria bacterium]